MCLSLLEDPFTGPGATTYAMISIKQRMIVQQTLPFLLQITNQLKKIYDARWPYSGIPGFRSA